MQNTRESGGATRIEKDALGHVSAEQFALWVRPEAMTHPRDEGRRDS